MGNANRDQLYESVMGTLSEHNISSPNISTDELARNIVDRLPVVEHTSDPDPNPHEVANGGQAPDTEVKADGTDPRPGGTGDGQPVSEQQAQGLTVEHVGEGGNAGDNADEGADAGGQHGTPAGGAGAVNPVAT